MPSRTPRQTHRRGLRREDGSVAVEVAIGMPILLMVLIGITMVAHGLTVRFVITGAAYDAARACGLAKTPTVDCAQAVVDAKLGGTSNRWCNATAVSVRQNAIPDVPLVQSLQVFVVCELKATLGTEMLRPYNAEITQVRASAELPY
ncbi:MAG: pilus assembly protein [Deltaproteobacteria bacterium]|nr:pilus assembly protein [Deltaproteobacteria bacterium]